MPSSAEPQRVIPAQLGFLAIYNPSLGTTDETIKDQIVYYSTPGLKERRAKLNSQSDADAAREENNEQLRQIGLAQGMVEFGRSFSDGRAVDTVETEKSRIVLHELESGWWILASINLTVLPGTTNTNAGKGKGQEHDEKTPEYSSREVKPAILLLGDLLRAHSTFLLHHASSMSALFVRTRRSKFMGILGRYWDTFLLTWNVLMHGNPANALYGGIKVAACGELGVGVGEEERGSAEREVLEGFVGRIEGLVDVIVSKFGEAEEPKDTGTPHQKNAQHSPTEPWLGSGNEPGAEDGTVFLGTGALSRKSLRDVSHWVEDLYKWGPYAYGVIDNPSSNRRTKKFKKRSPVRKDVLPHETSKKARQVYGLSFRDKCHRDSPPRQTSMATVDPIPDNSDGAPSGPVAIAPRPSLRRRTSSFTGSESDSTVKGSRFVQYLKFGYGTHWSLGSTSTAEASSVQPISKTDQEVESPRVPRHSNSPPRTDGTFETSTYAHKGSSGHYLIGLLGDIDDDDAEDSHVDPEEIQDGSKDDSNSRLLLRTLTLELERKEDARTETEISIDLGDRKLSQSTVNGSEHTGTSTTSYESQDRNKTKKLRVVVYVNRPFVFVFLFELRTDALALSSLYRSLHHQITPLMKPLLVSTAYRASKPEVAAAGESATPIYDLVWDPRLLTINSSIPNIPDPLQKQSHPMESLVWSRIEALNTHMQIVNTYVASSTDGSSLERTCKTSRGWWVVWTKIPDPDTSKVGFVVPSLVKEESQESQRTIGPSLKSGQTSTFGASMTSGPAHPYLESQNDEVVPHDKEIFLIRRASDHVAAKSAGSFASGPSVAASESSWISGPGKLAQGIGVDTKRYIEDLLNLNRHFDLDTHNPPIRCLLSEFIILCGGIINMVKTEDLRADKLFSVKNHVCVITGGGTGIGKRAAQALAANGAKVYITGRRVDALENAAKSHEPAVGGQIIPVGPCDVTKKEDLENLVAEISKKEKYINLLICSAGISGPKAEPESEKASELKKTLFEGESFGEWSDTFNTNVSGVYFTTVAFLPLLQAGRESHGHLSASVIVISSMSGIMNHAQGHFSYNAAKGATVHLSKLMAYEFKKAGIRVNSIAPGYFPSEMTTKKSDEEQKSELPDEKIEEKGHVPAQRAGSDEEMAQGIIFLAKNKYVNGEVIAIDGGVLLEVPGR
ncbi:putative Vacuolar fusion protein CCZ1 [Diplocarpon rosae]|nr:putative Vacuolar fusion protein CCZ1 [Diplocarpon rosae]